MQISSVKVGQVIKSQPNGNCYMVKGFTETGDVILVTAMIADNLRHWETVGTEFEGKVVSKITALLK